MLITFEGIDGSGKSTCIGSIAEHLKSLGHAVVMTREIGGTPLAENLRTLILHQPMDVQTEVQLAFAARRDHLTQVIAPALAAGAVVLCDRFTDSTFAYQGAGRGCDWSWIESLERQIQANCHPERSDWITPDRTLWFDVSPETAAARMYASRGGATDRFEAEDVLFFERVRQGYVRRRQQFPERFCRIDASQPKESVWEAVYLAIEGTMASAQNRKSSPRNGEEAR